jgi:Ca2+-binding EF-hand superfamily protein
MGNEIGKSSSRLGVVAMAFTTTNIEQAELTALSTALRTIIEKNPEKVIDKFSYVQLQEALKTIQKFEVPGDTEIFTSLYTMFDEQGEDLINYKEYMAGCSLLITGTEVEKLAFSFSMYDADLRKVVTRSDVRKIVGAINNVASFFGDPVLPSETLDSLVQNTFSANNGPPNLQLDICCKTILSNNVSEIFTAGKGSVRYGR